MPEPWLSTKGNPLNRESLRRILLRICTDAGLDGNRPPHAFRASFTERYLESPSSIRVLASRMGWSDKNHHMIDVYTRGAEVELARTTPVGSLSARWHAGSRPVSRQPALPTPRPQPGKRSRATSPDVQALVAAVKTDPELRRALLDAPERRCMKGGYQLQSRLATHLDEIRMEAQVAGGSQSRRERDRAFAEIQRLALACAQLLTTEELLAKLNGRNE